MIIVCWNNFIYSWFSRKGILQEQGFISALLHALRNFAGAFQLHISLQNRRNFLRISGQQRRKRGERQTWVAREGRNAKFLFFAPLLTRDSRFAFYLARDSRFNFRLDFRFPVSPMNRNRSEYYSEKVNFVEQSTSKLKCCASDKISQLSALG